MLYNSGIEHDGVKRTTDKNLYWIWQTVEVSIDVDGDKSSKMADADADVVFCLDMSASMGSSTETDNTLFMSVRAVKSLSKMLMLSGCKVGLVLFNDEIVMTMQPGNDYHALAQSLNTLKTGSGGTDIPKALGKAIELVNQGMSSNKYITLVSDGQADELATRTVIERSKGINFIGIGLGASSLKKFYESAFYDDNQDDEISHRASCCLDDYEILLELFSQIAVNANIMDIYGQDVFLEESPNTDNFEVLTQTDTESVYDLTKVNDKLQLSFLFYFYAPINLKYYLETESIGILSIAKQPVSFSYLSINGQDVEIHSGRSPLVLVLSPLLVFWMFLPLLALLAYLLLPKRKVQLMEPSEITFRPYTYTEKGVHKRKFMRKSTEVYESNGEGNCLITVVIYIGESGLNVFRDTIAQRRSAGLPEISDKFIPLLIDTVDNTPAVRKALLDKGIDLNGVCWKMPVSENLSDFINKIASNPSQYNNILSWFRADRYSGRNIYSKDGFEGDRKLARLALLYDISQEASTARKMEAHLKNIISTKKIDQIMMCGSVYEDKVSGWLLDLGLMTRSILSVENIPLYTVIAIEQTDKGRVSEESVYSMMHELKFFHGTCGYNYDLFEDIAPQNTALAPFDRIIMFTNNSNDGEFATTAQGILQLCDENAATELYSSDQLDTYNKRMASNRKADEILTLVNIDTVSVDLPLIKFAIAAKSSVSMLADWLGYDINDSNIQKNLAKYSYLKLKDDIVSHYSSYDNIVSALCSNNFSEPDQLSKEAFFKDFNSVTVDYLNGYIGEKQLSCRFVNIHHFFIDLYAELKNVQNMDALVIDCLSEYVEMLEAWNDKLAGCPEKNLQSVFSDIMDVLKFFENNSNQSVVSNLYKQEYKEKFENAIVSAVSNMHIRRAMRFIPGGGTADISLYIDGYQKIEYKHNNFNPHSIISQMEFLIESFSCPEMSDWNIEEAVDTGKLIKHISLKNTTYDTSVYSEFSNTAFEQSATELLGSEKRLFQHSFIDRVTLMHISNAERIGRISPYGSQSISAPVYSFSSIESRISPNENFEPMSMLMYRDYKTIYQVTAIYCSGFLKQKSFANGFDYIAFVSNSQDLQLTRAGDTDQQNALLNMVILQKDTYSNSVDMDMIMQEIRGAVNLQAAFAEVLSELNSKSVKTNLEKIIFGFLKQEVR